MYSLNIPFDVSHSRYWALFPFWRRLAAVFVRSRGACGVSSSMRIGGRLFIHNRARIIVQQYVNFSNQSNIMNPRCDGKGEQMLRRTVCETAGIT